jgi:8-oxo-dGTP pyrophosphatase MutT (NUDIX family)
MSAVSPWKPLEGLRPVADTEDAGSAVLVPLYWDGADLRLILTRRPDNMRTHAGDVVFPGGAIEAGDDGPVGAAIREAEEEVGLPADHVEVLGGLQPVSVRSNRMLIVPVVARVRRPAELIPQVGEVETIIEPTLADLLDEDTWRTEMWSGHRLWFREFPEGIMWGATARIVRELLDYLR